jgi:hypothetical protein
MKKIARGYQQSRSNTDNPDFKLNYSTIVKEHSVQQPQFLLFNLSVVLPWGAQALVFIESPVKQF